MDAILSIFQSLGVDQTVFVQFASVIVIFAILSCVLFPKVKEVLELRESKTTKLDGNANNLYKKAEEVSAQYKSVIEKTHQESQASATKKKSELTDSEKTQLKKTEEEIQKDYEAKKALVLKEIDSKKSNVLAEADQLSKTLLEKLTK
ncbi:MAG: hypothetical protein L6Q33_01375 [Bacteriovoracaceae bacterium]|jgi:F-type H+-transporting ATPase subunit b|nr:hypothetical protein [Bacteriovoracaceae bacterium]